MNITAERGILCLFLLLFICMGRPLCMAGQREETDTVTGLLEDLVVVGNSVSPIMVKDAGEIELNAVSLGRMIRVGGEADPLRYAMSLPGIAQGSDYSSGMNIMGADYSQSIIMMNGAPVYFPYHFGGIFSIFNSAHFKNLSIDKVVHDAKMQNRTGGLVCARSRTDIPEKIEGTVNLGMMASSLSLEAPVARRTVVGVAGRVSYINTFYKWLLDNSRTGARYDFSDMNLSVVHKLEETTILKFSYLGNTDNLQLVDKGIDNNTSLKWRNNVFSLSLNSQRRSGTSQEATLYYSEFSNRLRLLMSDLDMMVPSGIMTGGGRYEISVPMRAASAGWLEGGGELLFASFRSQYAEMEGMQKQTKTRIPSWEGRGYLQWRSAIMRNFEIAAGIKLSGYLSEGYCRGYVFPSLTVKWQKGYDNIKAGISIYPQYYHQVGLSEIGVSSNFWIGSCREVEPQKAMSVALAWNHRFASLGVDISLEPYYKRIYDHPEYEGTAFDLLLEGYSPYDHIISADGYDTGVSVTATRSIGRLTGWLGYSLGISRRKFPGETGYLPSVTETLNTLNLTASYRLSRHWRLSAVMAYSSGRPMTPIREIYLIAGNVIMSYGKKNSSRLPDYFRLDLSATYSFDFRIGKQIFPSYLNVSLINATGHRNTEVSYYKFSLESMTFYRNDVHSYFRFMPSLSFTFDIR